MTETADKKDGRRGRVEMFLRMLLRQRHTPEEIASGFALGLFLAFAAPPGIQMLPAAAIAATMRWSVPAAVAAVFVSNPVTMPFIYPLAAWLGSLVTGIPIRGRIPLTDEGFWMQATNLLLHGRIITLVLVGCVIIGSVAAFAGYFAMRSLARLYARRVHLELLLEKARKKGGGPPGSEGAD